METWWALKWLFDTIGKEPAVALLGTIGIIVWRLIWRQFLVLRCFWSSRSRALTAVAREKTADGLREGKGIWLQPTSKPDRYEDNFGTKILVVANNKGGVAKTTLAANLGAYWAREWDKRVLLIDLDYQGTLSNMALRKIHDSAARSPDSLANRAISGDLEANLLVRCAKEVPDEPRLKIVPADYDLAQADNRLIVEWLLTCAARRSNNIVHSIADFLYGRAFILQDVRSNLHDLLQIRAVRSTFDIIIIDCPPRLTAGVIQALCAATHVLIPTILDRTSAESEVYFCRELETLRTVHKICPKFDYVGVVGTMTSPNVDRRAERGAKDLI